MSWDVSKVRYISLIRIEGGESILNIPYAEMTVDPDLIAGFVTAVIIFAKTPIRTIRKAAYDILIEVGETVLILLVVDPVPDEAPYRVKMNRVLEIVEENYGQRLRNFEGDVRWFREFAVKILAEFPYFTADLDLVPVKKQKGHPIHFRVGQVDKKLEQIEAFINGKRTLAEIMDLINMTEDEVIGLISLLGKYEWIEFRKRLTENDILIKSNCSEPVLDRIRAQYGIPIDRLLEMFDGKRKIVDILEALPFDHNALWFLINKLVEVGCLKIMSV